MSKGNTYKTTVVTATGTLTQALPFDRQRAALLIFNESGAVATVSFNGVDELTIPDKTHLRFTERAPLNAVHVKGAGKVVLLTA